RAIRAGVLGPGPQLLAAIIALQSVSAAFALHCHARLSSEPLYRSGTGCARPPTPFDCRGLNERALDRILQIDAPMSGPHTAKPRRSASASSALEARGPQGV